MAGEAEPHEEAGVLDGGVEVAGALRRAVEGDPGGIDDGGGGAAVGRDLEAGGDAVVEERPAVHVGHDVDVLHLDDGAARRRPPRQVQLGDVHGVGDERRAAGGDGRAVEYAIQLNIHPGPALRPPQNIYRVTLVVCNIHSIRAGVNVTLAPK